MPQKQPDPPLPQNPNPSVATQPREGETLQEALSRAIAKRDGITPAAAGEKVKTLAVREALDLLNEDSDADVDLSLEVAGAEEGSDAT